ncbi:MAG: ScyD/ScyE family protein [Acidobacteriota bacterium]|nr:ScyD/ScyE family protein [Acidobacteriota bacterium]
MNRLIRPTSNTIKVLLTLMAVAALSLVGAEVRAQCPPDALTSGLQNPLGITQSNKNNLLVSETGTGAPGSGRISIVGLDGTRRTLLAGLPSGINDVNEPAGPAGLFMRGRTLYVLIGIGDTIKAGPIPGTAVPNPNGPSSPIFSSILAIHFSANVEKRTDGFTLSPSDQQALAGGEKVTLANGGGDKITIELVANFPDFTPNPLPFFAGNVRGSNPFDLVAVGNQLYVTDGGQNVVWQVDINSGAFSVLTVFAPIPNPFFNPTPPPPSLGGPFVEAVPTGITYSDGQLLVTLFRGFPFPPGASQVVAVDPQTGTQTPFITGLKSAIDVLPLTEGGDTDYLVLQHVSNAGPFLSGPGLLLHFETPGSASTVIANCLNRPTSMTLDEKTGTIYVTELVGGRVVGIPLP